MFTEMGVNITGLHTDWAEQATAQGPQTPGGGFFEICTNTVKYLLMLVLHYEVIVCCV